MAMPSGYGAFRVCKDINQIRYNERAHQSTNSVPLIHFEKGIGWPQEEPVLACKMPLPFRMYQLLKTQYEKVFKGYKIAIA